jgi:hypothetical protein
MEIQLDFIKNKKIETLKFSGIPRRKINERSKNL